MLKTRKPCTSSNLVLWPSVRLAQTVDWLMPNWGLVTSGHSEATSSTQWEDEMALYMSSSLNVHNVINPGLTCCDFSWCSGKGSHSFCLFVVPWRPPVAVDSTNKSFFLIVCEALYLNFANTLLMCNFSISPNLMSTNWKFKLVYELRTCPLIISYVPKCPNVSTESSI